VSFRSAVAIGNCARRCRTAAIAAHLLPGPWRSCLRYGNRGRNGRSCIHCGSAVPTGWLPIWSGPSCYHHHHPHSRFRVPHPLRPCRRRPRPAAHCGCCRNARAPLLRTPRTSFPARNLDRRRLPRIYPHRGSRVRISPSIFARCAIRQISTPNFEGQIVSRCSNGAPVERSCRRGIPHLQGTTSGDMGLRAIQANA
jgi:hypothetical protein